MSELLGQSETVPHMFGRHKVLGHLDTAVEVVHLEGEGIKRNHDSSKQETNIDDESNDKLKNGHVQASDLVWRSSWNKHSIS